MPVEREDGWWRDPEMFRFHVIDEGLSNREAAARYGVGEYVIRKWRKRHGHPASDDRGAATRRVVELGHTDDDSWLLGALKKLGDSATVEEIADHCQTFPRRVRDAAERLGHGGFRISEDKDQRVTLARVPPPSDNVHRALFSGERIRFGVISDTHLGSKHERLEELHHAYRMLADEGITTVYHPGDLVCGYGIFPGQVNEVNLHTYEDQVAYALENYPKVDGITTHIIAGNHDIEGQFGKIGANPVVAVCNQRDDMVYAGDYRTVFELEQGTRIYLLHPKGGMGYAADYKIRKLAEGFEGGAKPNVLLVGHFHRRGQFEARGIQCLLAGCFESGGSFGVRLGLSDPAVGFHVVEMTVGDDGSVVRFNVEWFRFWAGRKIAA